MLESPLLGRSPIRLLNADGMRIEPQVSEPNPAAAKLAAHRSTGATATSHRERAWDHKDYVSALLRNRYS